MIFDRWWLMGRIERIGRIGRVTGRGEGLNGAHAADVQVVRLREEGRGRGKGEGGRRSWMMVGGVLIVMMHFGL